MIVAEKDDLLFGEIQRITEQSFFGVERPNELALRHMFDTGDVFVDDNGNVIRGYALVTKVAGQPWLSSIATRTGWRKFGVASGLLDEIITYYKERGFDIIDLTVNVNNPAQKLYFDKGWRASRVLLNYYGSDSGIRMRRIL